MTRREVLVSFIVGPFTAKGLAKLPVAEVAPIVAAVATPITPMMSISFIASGAVCSEQMLKHLPRALKNGGAR